MTDVVADTHAIIWFVSDFGRLSPAAGSALMDTIRAGGSALVASITLVEMTYLVEKRRIAPEVLDALTSALDDPASGIAPASPDRPVATALLKVPRHEVPDMPDRMIAATALHLGLPLVSRDRKIAASTIQTIW